MPCDATFSVFWRCQTVGNAGVNSMPSIAFAGRVQTVSYTHLDVYKRQAYRRPTPAFVTSRDYVAFYPQLMDSCTVDGELVTPQPGEFYGGWITSDVVGPFKGEPGSWGW